MAKIKIDDLEKSEKITDNDLRKVKGGSLYSSNLSRSSMLRLSSRLVRPSIISEFKPNFNPYATENATAGIRG